MYGQLLSDSSANCPCTFDLTPSRSLTGGSSLAAPFYPGGLELLNLTHSQRWHGSAQEPTAVRRCAAHTVGGVRCGRLTRYLEREAGDRRAHAACDDEHRPPGLGFAVRSHGHQLMLSDISVSPLLC